MPRKHKTQEAVSSEIAELASLDRKRLLSRWLDLFGSDPPRGMRRDLLFRAKAHRLQVKAWGGLSRASERALAVAGSAARPEGPVYVQLKPGTRLVRVWHGQMYEVEVLADGFAWNGARYRRSLAKLPAAAKEGKTEIARVTCRQFRSHCLPAARRRLPSVTEQARVQIQHWNALTRFGAGGF